MSILVINGSTRENGNTELLTKKLLEGIPHTVVFLKDKNILPIKDARHDAAGFQPVLDDYDEMIEQIFKHDTLIFATPLYWYGMSGCMKDFIDRWSQYLRDSRFNFKEEMGKKKAFVVICGGDNPKLKALPLVQQFQYIFDFMGMEFAGYIIGKGNAPGEIENDIVALAQAEQMNKVLKNQ